MFQSTINSFRSSGNDELPPNDPERWGRRTGQTGNLPNFSSQGNDDSDSGLDSDSDDDTFSDFYPERSQLENPPLTNMRTSPLDNPEPPGPPLPLNRSTTTYRGYPEPHRYRSRTSTDNPPLTNMRTSPLNQPGGNS